MEMAIIVGILICVGFMGLIITIMRAMIKAKKLKRQQQRQFDNYDPYEKE